MKSYIKATAAAGLAAASIVSGLSFGPAVANAAPATAAPTAVDALGWTDPFKLVLDQNVPEARFVGLNIDWRPTYGTFMARAYSTASEADTASTPNLQYNVYSRVLRVGTSDTCVVDGGTLPNNAVTSVLSVVRACGAVANQPRARWSFRDGQLVSDTGRSVGSTSLREFKPFSLVRDDLVYATAAAGTPTIADGYGAKILSASVKSTDVTSRTAVIGGYAAAGSTVVIGGAEIDTAPDGQWFHTVTGLSLGSNPIHIEQWQAGEKTAETDLTVRLDVRALTATATFGNTVSQNVTVSGTAEPRAEIDIHDTNGTKVATGMADSNGDYSIPLEAPNQAGDYAITVSQKVNGEVVSDQKNLTVAYGTGVSITSPTAGATHNGGALTVRGAGQANATVTVREKGSSTFLATAQVSANTLQYALQIPNLDATEHVLEVRQTSKGNNVTTAEVTVNAGQHQDQDVTLTSPVSGSEFTPNTPLTFTGTGAPGGKITLIAGQGLADFTTTVDTAGNWTINRPMGGGAYTFTVKQEINGKTSTVDNIRLTPAGATVTKPFAVTSPESGSFHQNEVVTFTGTGTPGQTIELDPKNAGLATVTTVVGQNGNWSLNRYLGSGAYDFDVRQKNGGTVTGEVRNLRINQTADVSLPFAVTSPIDGSEHKGEMVTFTGTGTAGETITLHVTNFASSDVTTTVKADGSWSAQKYIGTGPYTIDITQKNAAGTTTGEKVGFKINQPAGAVNLPFEVTTPAEDTTFTPGGMFTFEGTGAADATVTVDPGQGLAKVTTTVKGNGHWSVQKFLGNGTYTFTISHTDGSGTVTKAPVTLTPTK